MSEYDDGYDGGYIDGQADANHRINELECELDSERDLKRRFEKVEQQRDAYRLTVINREARITELERELVIAGVAFNESRVRIMELEAMLKASEEHTRHYEERVARLKGALRNISNIPFSSSVRLQDVPEFAKRVLEEEEDND